MSWVFRKVSKGPTSELSMDYRPEMLNSLLNLIETLIENEEECCATGAMRRYLDGSLNGKKGSVLITVLNEDGGAEYEYELNHVENK